MGWMLRWLTEAVQCSAPTVDQVIVFSEGIGQLDGQIAREALQQRQGCVCGWGVAAKPGGGHKPFLSLAAFNPTPLGSAEAGGRTGFQNTISPASPPAAHPS